MSSPTRRRPPGKGPSQGSGGHTIDNSVPDPYDTEQDALTLDLGIDPEPIILCSVCGGRIFHPDQQIGDRHRWCVDRNAGVYSPATSHRAAAVAAKSLPKRAELVLGRLEQAGHVGRTDDELAESLPSEHPGSVAKARLSLTRKGLVVDSGRRRPTRRGVDAIVWEVVR